MTQTVRSVHVVLPGELLEGIAEAHGVELSALLALNGIADPTEIEVGQELAVEAQVVEVVEIFPARPQRLTSPAADRQGLLNEFEWPIEMAIGRSATVFVVVAGLAMGFALLAVHSALSLAIEGVGDRVPGFSGSWRRGDDDETASTEWGPALVQGLASRVQLGRPSSRELRSLMARSGAALASALSAARRGGLLAGRALRRRAPYGARVLRAPARAGSRVLAAVMRLMRRLRERAAASARGAGTGRRRGNLRREIEGHAEVKLRMGLVEEAEALFWASLAECEAGGWPVEAGLCLRGLAEIAETRGKRTEAVELISQAIALFEEHQEDTDALKARMQLQLIEQRVHQLH